MAQRFDQSWIDKVKDSCDIVDVISRYVPLKQKGRTYWGNCPFHHENEPSFAVSPERQIFKCFGCQVSGNAITFVSKYESLSFIETLKLLASKNNIEIPQNIDDETIKKNAIKKAKILEINKISARFYNKVLMSEQGTLARKYLYNRELTDNILTRFGMGYSPDWTSLVEHLKNQNIDLEDAVMAGVLGKKNNNKYYDFFAERIVFPIIDTRGEVIGFSARVITKEYSGGKYKNSPDSLCFNKSNTLYGINLLKKSSQQMTVEYAIICEGQMDVIAMHQCGFNNAIAALGTALTFNHAKEIKRFVNKVIVCFDGDGAGIKATLRSLDILDRAQLQVFVLTLPEKMDPDEYVKKYGKEKMQELLNHAKPKNDYIFDTITSKFDLSNNKDKTDYIKEVLEFIDKLSTNAEKEIYLKQVKNLTKIPVEVLKQDLAVVFDNQFQEVSVKKSSAYDEALTFVFSALLNRKEYAKQLDTNIINSSFYSSLNEFLKDNEISDDIFEILETKFGENTELDALKNFKFEMITNEVEYYKDCFKIIKLEALETEQKILYDNIKTATDPIIKREYMSKLNKILDEIMKYKN